MQTHHRTTISSCSSESRFLLIVAVGRGSRSNRRVQRGRDLTARLAHRSAATPTTTPTRTASSSIRCCKRGLSVHQATWIIRRNMSKKTFSVFASSSSQPPPSIQTGKLSLLLEGVRFVLVVIVLVGLSRAGASPIGREDGQVFRVLSTQHSGSRDPQGSCGRRQRLRQSGFRSLTTYKMLMMMRIWLLGHHSKPRLVR